MNMKKRFGYILLLLCMVANLIAEPVKYEAENMLLKNYIVEIDSSNSGGKRVRLNRSEGSVQMIFDLPDGVYDLDIAYFDENDGDGYANVLVNGIQKDTWVWDSDIWLSKRKVLEGYTFHRGDIIEIQGHRNIGEFGRLDYIEFTPNKEESGDTVAPVITLNGVKSVTLYIGKDYIELGASAIDYVDGSLNVTIEGSVDTSHIGQYILTYRAMDTSGNEAIEIRTINVLEHAICASFDACRIKPYSANHWFWQYEGKPVLLLGGSSDDNLFQHADVEVELNLIQSVGGNYVRNTMSSSAEKNLQPFYRQQNGLYDLTRWNDAYWDRFEAFISMCEVRNIIVQIEIWDRFDHSRTPWTRDPYNPKNNINYTSHQSGLAQEYPAHPLKNKQPFFHTVPKMDDNIIVRKYQEAFVEKLLSYTLQYKNILYVIDNETGESIEWSNYWAQYIRNIAQNENKHIEVTEMKDNNDLHAPAHRQIWDNRRLYSFIEISQNNHNTNEQHWKNTAYAKNYLFSNPRPMNNIKIYGGSRNGYHGSPKQGIDWFWLNILEGSATARFHRDPYGHGIDLHAQTQIKIVREIERSISFFSVEANNDLLRDRSQNEAFLTYKKGEAYIVFFPSRGNVKLDLSSEIGQFKIRWVNIEDGTWSNETSVNSGSFVSLDATNNKGSIAILYR